MSFQTRAQKDLILAMDLVGDVRARHNEEVQQIYGGMCHNFPVMVRTCGLCQAIAFSEDKSASDGDRGTAHKLLLSHVGKVLGAQDKQLLHMVRSADVVTYMQYTRQLLDSWIYFKRFAVSILKAEAGQKE